LKEKLATKVNDSFASDSSSSTLFDSGHTHHHLDDTRCLYLTNDGCGARDIDVEDLDVNSPMKSIWVNEVHETFATAGKAQTKKKKGDRKELSRSSCKVPGRLTSQALDKRRSTTKSKSKMKKRKSSESKQSLVSAKELRKGKHQEKSPKYPSGTIFKKEGKASLSSSRKSKLHLSQKYHTPQKQPNKKLLSVPERIGKATTKKTRSSPNTASNPLLDTPGAATSYRSTEQSTYKPYVYEESQPN